MSQSLRRKVGKFPGCRTPWQNYWWPEEVLKEWLFAYSKAKKSHIYIPKMCSYMRYAFVNVFTFLNLRKKSSGKLLI